MNHVDAVPLENVYVRRNPRTVFDPDGLRELAESIRREGLLQPLVARTLSRDDLEEEHRRPQLPDGGDGAGPPEDGPLLELVVGERRLRAHGLLEAETVRVHVRELTDAEAAELQLVENYQREDLSPLEEAQAFDRYLEAGTAVDQLEELTARSASYIHKRRKLLELIPSAQEALEVGDITLAHALEIARLDPGLQPKALAAIHHQPMERHWTEPAKWRDRRDGAISAQALRAWIRTSLLLDLEHAPWTVDDQELPPLACRQCPKRTGNQAALFPEVESGNVCTDRSCYQGKMEAHIQRQLDAWEEEGVTYLRLTRQWQPSDGDGDLIYARNHDVQLLQGQEPCEHAFPALWMDGPDAGETTTACLRTSGCEEHHARASREVSEERKRAEARTEERKRQRGAYRRELYASLVDHGRDLTPLSAETFGLLLRLVWGDLYRKDKRKALEARGVEIPEDGELPQGVYALDVGLERFLETSTLTDAVDLLWTTLMGPLSRGNPAPGPVELSGAELAHRVDVAPADLRRNVADAALVNGEPLYPKLVVEAYGWGLGRPEGSERNHLLRPDSVGTGRAACGVDPVEEIDPKAVNEPEDAPLYHHQPPELDLHPVCGRCEPLAIRWLKDRRRELAERGAAALVT